MTRDQKAFLGFLSLVILSLPLLVSPYFVSYFSLVKWEVVYLTTLIGGVYLLGRKAVKIPEIPKALRVLFIGLLGIAFINHFIQNISFLSEITLDRIAFGILVLLFYNLFKEETNFFNFLAIIISIATGLFLIAYWISTAIGFDFIEEKGTHTAFTFGNNNMAAEFVGFSILFQLYSLYKNNQKILRLFLLPTLFLSIVYILLTASRSVTLALAFGGVAYFLLQPTSTTKKLTQITATFLILSLVFVGQYFSWHPITQKLHTSFQENSSVLTTPQKYDIKSFTIKQRLGLWESTFQMIKDHPLGVGPDRFDFYVTPYKKDSEILAKFKMNVEDPFYYESWLEKTPHNEYLRILAEDGIPFFLIASLIVTMLGFLLWRSRQANPYQDILISFFIFFAVQASFQFPLLNPIPFLFIAMMTGLLCSTLFKGRVYRYGYSSLFSISGVYCALFITLLTSRLIEANSMTDADKTRLACRLNPANWRGCMNPAYVDLANGNLDEAKKQLISELEKNPFNYSAMRVLFVVYELQEDYYHSCKIALTYDEIFGRDSLLSGSAQGKCFGMVRYEAPIALSRSLKQFG